MKRQLFLTTVGLLVLSFAVRAQVVINEVLYDPLGENAGHQLVEIKNADSDSVRLAGWWFCARQDYAQIPTVTLAPGAFLVIHIGASGTNSNSELFLPSMLPLQAVSDLALYSDANFPNPNSMVDFVQWGGVPPVGRQMEAATIGQWTAGEFVPTVAEGHSIEYDGEGDRAVDWFDQPNPTIGSENTVTSVERIAGVPARFQLHQNFPNPFNPTTEIRFDLNQSGHTVLKVYNLLGQEVATLVNEPLLAGSYKVTFEAGTLSSGMYLYRLQSNGTGVIRRMILLR